MSRVTCSAVSTGKAAGPAWSSTRSTSPRSPGPTTASSSSAPSTRHWDRIVEAWAAADDQALDDAWINEAVVDLGSQWGQYEYVTTIGFAA